MISSLTKYKTGFSIRARITNISDLKKFSRRDGSTDHLINVDIIDASKKETYITIFGDKATVVAQEMKKGQVYIISGIKVTAVTARNAAFHKGNWDNYFTADASFSFVADQSAGIPVDNYNFIKDFSALNLIADNTSIDILGVVHEAKDLSNIKTKAGRDLTKREIVIVDANNAALTATLWGETANSFNAATGSVVALKQAKVSSFQGKKQISVSSVAINPTFSDDIALNRRAMELRASYNPLAVISEAAPVSSSFGAKYQSAEMAREANPMEQSEAIWIDFFPWIKDPVDGSRAPFYSACQGTFNGRPCMKKREADKPCDRCGDSNAPQPCYILRSSLSDATGSVKAFAFGEKADSIIGVSAAVLSANSYDSSGTLINNTYTDRCMFSRPQINLRITPPRNSNDNGPSINVNRASIVSPAKIAKSIISGLKEYAELE